MRLQERVSLVFDGNDRLAGLAGDFMPGVSRDEAILGSPGSTIQREPQSRDRDQPAPRAGSLLEEIQREVDSAEPVPVPVPEPLESNPL